MDPDPGEKLYLKSRLLLTNGELPYGILPLLKKPNFWFSASYFDSFFNINHGSDKCLGLNNILQNKLTWNLQNKANQTICLWMVSCFLIFGNRSVQLWQSRSADVTTNFRKITLFSQHVLFIFIMPAVSSKVSDWFEFQYFLLKSQENPVSLGNEVLWSKCHFSSFSVFLNKKKNFHRKMFLRPYF